MEIALREEKQRCLTLKEEVFDKFLKLLERELNKKQTFKSGKDIIEVAHKVAEQFATKYPSIGKIFEGEAYNCKDFFDIFTEKERKKLHTFAENVNLSVEVKNLKEVVADYLNSIFSIFKGRKNIYENFKQSFASLVVDDKPYKVKVASLIIKDKTQKTYDVDPLLLTYRIVFSPYGGNVTSSLEGGKLGEDVKQFLEKRILEKLKEEEGDSLIPIEEIVEEKLKESGEKVDLIIEELFEAIDSHLRARINLENFLALLEYSEQTIEDNNLKGLLWKVVSNLKLLKELLEEDSSFWKFVVEVLPVGPLLDSKITDYKAQKNFWHFLYTYKVKVNEIPQGVVEQFLNEPVKSRSEYYLKLAGKLYRLLREPTRISDDERKNLRTYLLALIKALFYYSEVDKRTAEQLYNLYQQLEYLKFSPSNGTEKFTPAEMELFKEIQKVVSPLLKRLSLTYKNYEKLYKQIVKVSLNNFVKHHFPSKPLQFLIAVDFEGLAEVAVKAIKRNELETKTKRYRGLIRLLASKEKLPLNFLYILKATAYPKNFPLDINPKYIPQVKTLRPIKVWNEIFNATAELRGFEFGLLYKKQTYKFAFILSFLIVYFLILKKVKGTLLGFSLPANQPMAGLLYNLSGAATFVSINEKRLTLVQNFNFADNRTNPPIIKGKIENGLTSLLSNLPFEVEGVDLSQPVGILVIDHPERKDKSVRTIVGEAYIFRPAKEKKRLYVSRRSLIGHFSPIEGDRKSFIEDYKITLKEFLKSLERFNLTKVYIIPPLPLYKGLSTKEILYKELYFSENFAQLSEEMGIPIKELFTSYAVVYTPKLTQFKRKLENFFQKRGVGSIYRQPFAANLFEGIEQIVEIGGATPLVIPKFAIIPLFTLGEGNERLTHRTLNHHAFIYSTPHPELFGGLKPEYITLSEEEKKQLIELLGIIHLVQYQKSDSQFNKTYKRNPFYVLPIRRSGDKNIYALTEVELFFNRETKPKLQTVLLAQILKNSIF